MNGSSGAGQSAVGGVGGAMAATSRPASIPALPVGPSTTETVLGGIGKGLQGFSSLMQGAGGAPGAIRTPPSRGGAPVDVADYTLPQEADPFAAALQKLDPNYLRSLFAKSNPI